MSLRRVLHWKYLFHDLTLPSLRRLPPELADRLLASLGEALLALQPGRRRSIRIEVERVNRVLGLGWDLDVVRRAVARSIPRYAARDCLLDGLSDEAAAARFEWSGREAVDESIASGRGVILVGSHFGAHVPLLHALYRVGMPIRFLVQRPSHTSAYLQECFDRDDPRPQTRFFVRRGLGTGEAAEKILLARGALRDGQAIYINGDILWTGANTRVGCFLGRRRRFLALWADLSVLTGAPAVFVRASFRPGGRYAFEFDPPLHVQAGEEQSAFESQLERIERAIASDPGSAVPYLTWPAFVDGEDQPPDAGLGSPRKTL